MILKEKKHIILDMEKLHQKIQLNIGHIKYYGNLNKNIIFYYIIKYGEKTKKRKS